ncbi:methyltransferase [Rhodococcoides yunnanense]|uniref:Methyltransferase n=1 Tax=Rhodococcoides yunnanense TaxID=278209 RepID=A0ABU4BIC0_9NOCA|nr:methyltransferase [Rhodococcus yunnanensis]MDV6263945.1 methyltransferase [Rhodococcus yunnanensis]
MSIEETTPPATVGELPPEFTALMRLGDLATPMAVRVAANLRLVDHIHDGAHDLESLSKASAANRDSLRRLIRHLIAINVLSEPTPDYYEPTEIGKLLASDHPVTQLGWLDPAHMIGRADLALVDLFDAVRDGRAVYKQRYGKDFWEDVSDDQVLGDTFYDLMAHGQLRIFKEVVEQGEWDGVRHILDVGGADGDLISALLSREPGIRATLLELPGPAARARTKLARAGQVDRFDVVDGSFFEPLPVTADLITLSFVLHNWSDEDAVRILHRCVDALEPGGSILLIECAEQSHSTPDPGFTSGDLRMMVYFEGRERTYDEWVKLADAAGLEITSVSDAYAYGARVLKLVRRSSQ